MLEDLYEDLTAITSLSRDLKRAAASLTEAEARYLVDTYYSLQDQRKRADNQIRALNETGEPHEIIVWQAANYRKLEQNIAKALDAYSAAQPLGEWARSIIGIGPVISAGLLAHIDMQRVRTAGQIWRFAGLDPSVQWEKGQKRPWNAELKTLCWKIGESFVKVSGNEGSFYGRIYSQRKALELQRNEAGEFADQAKAKLERFNIGKSTEARAWYEAGKLPPAHIHSRAKRYAVKLFLAHYFETGYALIHGETPPKPYVIEHMGHVKHVAANEVT